MKSENIACLSEQNILQKIISTLFECVACGTLYHIYEVVKEELFVDGRIPLIF